MFDVLQRHTDRICGGPQGVDRGPGPQQHVTGKAEQAAAPLGFDHVVGRETESRQVLDQAGPLACMGDPCCLKRLEIQGIGHLAKCASRVAD